MIAGQYLRSIQYTLNAEPDVRKDRCAKTQISSAAREAMNLRYSYQKLKALIAANFSPNDLVVTLTYSDETLPRLRKDAENRLKLFLRRLRAERRAAGYELPYVYVTEMGHSTGRLHHHLITNAVGNDYEQIRRLWAKNGTNIDVSHIKKEGYDRWAEYLSKESREYGRHYVGERMWRQSIGLKKPITYTGWVDPNARLDDLPDGTIFLGAPVRMSNGYGSFEYIEALLPASFDVSALELISALG